ncbi:MAG: hypothetical protein ACOZB3_05560 [Calditrichota bacterium]
MKRQTKDQNHCDITAKVPYVCDVCGLRFEVSAGQAAQVEPLHCPRCRVTLVRPVLRKGQRADAVRQMTLYRGLACG